MSTIDHFLGYDWSADFQPSNFKGFKDFNKDMKRVKEHHPSVIMEQSTLDIFTLKPAGDRVGTSPLDDEIEDFEAENHSSYKTISNHGLNHHVTYIVDKFGRCFASILWRGEHHGKLNEDLCREVNYLPAFCSGDIEESWAKGFKFSAAHAILRGMDEAHPRNMQGNYDISFNAKFASNMKYWAPFLWSEPVESIKRRTTRFLHRSFPLHGQFFMDIATSPLLRPVWPCGGFLMGHHSSFALNNLSANTVMRPHRDTRDLVTSLCGVYPFGHFDPMFQDSGALLLHEAKCKLLL